MGRATREWVIGAIYHVFSRGSNRQAIFLNDGDYVEFEMLLASAFRKHKLDCSAGPSCRTTGTVSFDARKGGSPAS
jgi:hypothetical protein